MSRLALSLSLRAAAERIAVVKACLIGHGLRTTGGVILPSQGADSPDGELVTSGAFIAFYIDSHKAQRLEAGVRRNARRFDGRVERKGAITVLWIHRPANALHSIVSHCAFA